MEPVDKKLQRMFHDLGRAVFDAISESSDVSETVNRFRAEGYSLTMQLNCKKDTAESDPPENGHVSSREPDPTFRIDGQDLSFLESIGIDPTRRRPRRR